MAKKGFNPKKHDSTILNVATSRYSNGFKIVYHNSINKYIVKRGNNKKVLFETSSINDAIVFCGYEPYPFK